MKRVVSIVGPTASGKTGLGIAIAKRLAEAGERAEIVNADAYQMYRGMDIGTAKASAEEQAAVPHHLIDIIDPEDTMTVARFQQLARQTITDLQSRDIRPILVGGSGCMPGRPLTTLLFPALILMCANGSRNAKKPRGRACCSTNYGIKTPKPPRAWIRATRDAPFAHLKSSSLLANRIRQACRATVM